MKALFETSDDNIIAYMDENGSLFLQSIRDSTRIILDPEETEEFIKHLISLRSRHKEYEESKRSWRQQLMRTLLGGGS